MLKININNLNDGEHIFDFVISPADLDIDIVDIVSDVKVAANLYKSGSQISVNVTADGKFKFQCDRCLDDYISDFETKFEIIYKFDALGNESDNDDIKFISANIRHIDLRDDVRDYILLSIPMRNVPEEKNGVCLYCNKKIEEILNIKNHESVNPVWEKLIKAKIK